MNHPGRGIHGDEPSGGRGIHAGLIRKAMQHGQLNRIGNGENIGSGASRAQAAFADAGRAGQHHPAGLRDRSTHRGELVMSSHQRPRGCHGRIVLGKPAAQRVCGRAAEKLE
jgi:hypothetical protein